MSTEITDKTWVVITRSAGRFYITQAQSDQVKMLIAAKESFIDIEGNVIMLSDVAGVVSGSQIDELDRSKRGDWKCKWNQWHTRGQQCAHSEVYSGRI